MPNAATHLRRIAVLAVVVIASVPAWAATAQRTFVASTGNDANDCSRFSPCRNFARAITQTNAGGEVIVLDSSGYGAVTITQPVSLIAPPGVYGGISVFSGDGVTLNAPSGIVVLRGLTINGQGGNSGINVGGGQEVHIENVVVANMAASGIFVNASVPVQIKDSIFRDNAGSGIAVYAGTVTAENVRSEGNGAHGLYIQAGFAAVSAGFFNQNLSMGVRADGGHLTLHGTTIAGNGGNGVFTVGNTTVVLDECAIAENASNGIEVHGDFAGYPYTTVSRSSVSRNGRGASIPNGSGIIVNNFGGCLNCATLYLTGSAVMRNSYYDVDATNCCLVTYQNNTVQNVLGTSFSSQSLF